MTDYKREGLIDLARAKGYIAVMDDFLEKLYQKQDSQKQEFNKIMEQIEDSVNSAFQNFKFIEEKEIFKFDIAHGIINSITDESKTLTNLIIPPEINGVKVAMIGYDAFRDCKSLKSIVIPDSVTTIGDQAFNDCCCLTNVVIPNSVTSIGPRAFHGCSSLASIIIPNSVTSVGSGAFENCTALTKVTVGNKITWFGSNVFRGCTSLEDIKIRKE